MAQISPRHRFNFMLHKNLSEDLQCLVNAVNENSYVPPHRHISAEDRRETFTIERGHLWIVIFEENGKIKEKIKLDAKDPNAQKTFVIETGAIHTVVSDGPFVVLELKQHPEGGYDKNTDKEMFPKWSPPEKSPRAKKYYRNLLQEVLCF